MRAEGENAAVRPGRCSEDLWEMDDNQSSDVVFQFLISPCVGAMVGMWRSPSRPMIRTAPRYRAEVETKPYRALGSRSKNSKK